MAISTSREKLLLEVTDGTGRYTQLLKLYPLSHKWQNKLEPKINLI